MYNVAECLNLIRILFWNARCPDSIQDDAALKSIFTAFIFCALHVCLIHLDSLFSSTLQMLLNFQSTLVSSPQWWSWWFFQQQWQRIVSGTAIVKVQSDKMSCFLWVMCITGCAASGKSIQGFLSGSHFHKMVYEVAKLYSCWRRPVGLFEMDTSELLRNFS